MLRSGVAAKALRDKKIVLNCIVGRLKAKLPGLQMLEDWWSNEKRKRNTLNGIRNELSAKRYRSVCLVEMAWEINDWIGTGTSWNGGENRWDDTDNVRNLCGSHEGIKAKKRQKNIRRDLRVHLRVIKHGRKSPGHNTQIALVFLDFHSFLTDTNSC